MAGPASHTSRAEQRRQTEARILATARQLFSEHGYDRTTIRAVARAAKVNPGLVMHYFGSKEQLFTQASAATPDEPISGTPEQLTEQLLATLHDKLTHEPTATLAMLRSMLTHPDATEGVRASLSRQQEQLSDILSADDALLRTGLTGAISLGVVIGRHLLQLDGLRDAPPDQIIELLRPCFESLTASGDS
ncbi:TetR family transcriptional regulator [Saccharomonospora sp. NPDC046836]|uniref:TetR/AcrR family transcriptional regulator n=1 Tax=Saccharomonospora sp. NPDC046836 TaxID=3156921 RepID=UPI0033F24B87